MFVCINVNIFDFFLNVRKLLEMIVKKLNIVKKILKMLKF